MEPFWLTGRSCRKRCGKHPTNMLVRERRTVPYRSEVRRNVAALQTVRNRAGIIQFAADAKFETLFSVKDL